MIIGMKAKTTGTVLGFFLIISLLLPTMRCNAEGSVSGSDVISVIAPVEEEILVTELDLGDCPREIVVGTSQMISVLTIPSNATETTFSYKSDNTDVASINALGRLTGHKVGTARITVTCGNVQNTFTVAVVEDSSNIAVQDIEIEDIEEEVNVNEKVNIYAKVLPSNATNATVTYKSSDTQIATVNSSGEVKGIAPGQVTIAVCAGGIVKQIPLTVKIATTNIQLNSEYLVLKPDATFQIEAKVQPQGASGKVTYKSLDTTVASVSAAGMITAKSCGNTAIVVSNGDIQVTVSVIVNETGEKENAEVNNNHESNEVDIFFPDKINAEKYSVITSEMLKYFYENEKVLTVEGSSYIFFLDGKKIINFENEIFTDLIFEEQDNGFTFIVNDGKKLSGEITLDISDKITSEKYLYLYNEAKQKYEKLEVEDIGLLNIDIGGKYLVSSQKLQGAEVNSLFVAGGMIVVVIAGGVYIVVKKRYWFW